jgi:ribosome-interacting GTPase 1
LTKLDKLLNQRNENNIAVIKTLGLEIGTLKAEIARIKDELQKEKQREIQERLNYFIDKSPTGVIMQLPQEIL